MNYLIYTHFRQTAYLLKVTPWYVAPYISIEINQHIVESVKCVKQFRHIVMSLNLQK